MKKRELAAGFFWGPLGLGITLKSLEYGVGSLRHPESGFLPFWAGILIVILSLLVMRQSLKAEPAAPPFFSPNGGLRRMSITFLLLAGYVVVVSKIGFVLSTLLLTGILLRTVYPQPWWKTVTFSTTVSVLSYFVFGRWLNVQLPRGWIGF